METMLAALYEESGDATVLQVREVERPEPGPGQVRVRIAVSAINPTDVKIRGGMTPRPIDGFQVPHMDGAGTIDAVGRGVDHARVSERVWVQLAAHGSRYGTAAQWTVVDAERAVPLPASASFDLGATLGVPAVTAANALFADGSIEGERVLIAGGAGGVGRCAVELAKWAGARVAATASSAEKADIARRAGADFVLDYREASAPDALQAWAPQVRRIVELDLGRNLDLDLAVTGYRTVIVVYATPGADPVIPLRRLMTAHAHIRFSLLYSMPQEVRAAAVASVSRALANGALTTPPLLRYSLTDIADAQRAQEAGPTGRIIVDIP